MKRVQGPWQPQGTARRLRSSSIARFLPIWNVSVAGNAGLYLRRCSLLKHLVTVYLGQATRSLRQCPCSPPSRLPRPLMSFSPDQEVGPVRWFRRLLVTWGDCDELRAAWGAGP